MSKPLFLFVFLLPFNAMKGKTQTIDLFIADCRQAIPSLTKLKNVITKYSKDTAAFRIYKYEGRTNYFEIDQSRYMISKVDHSRDNKLLFRYHLEINSEDNIILYCNFFKSYDGAISFSTYENIIDYRDTLMAKQNIAEFNRKYSSSFSINDYFRELDYDIFGIRWGLPIIGIASVFKPMETVYKMVLAKNSEGILKLCNSLCNETKCYGVAGLFLLQKQGFKLDTEAAELFKKIKYSEDMIYFAWGGCEIEKSKISDVFNNDYFEEIYNSFKDYKEFGLKGHR